MSLDQPGSILNDGNASADVEDDQNGASHVVSGGAAAGDGDDDNEDDASGDFDRCAVMRTDERFGGRDLFAAKMKH